MPTSLRSFQERMRRLAATIPADVGTVTEQIATKVHAPLVYGTPVDRTDDADDVTARSNWNVGLDSPDDTFSADESPEDTLRRGRAVMGGRVRDGQTVYISNGGAKVPYLSRLNRGWSKQAPAGFVEAAVRAGLQAVQSVRILRRRR
jgi:hypothetical protein